MSSGTSQRGGFCQAMTTPLPWIPTEVQLADALTKVMDATRLRDFMRKGTLQLPMVDTRAGFAALQKDTGFQS